MTPQSGLLPEGNAHGLFLTLDLSRDPTAPAAARSLLAQIPAMTTTLAAAAPGDGLVSVASIGTGIWSTLTDAAKPKGMADFRARANGPRKAPATPADLLLHIRSERRDLNHALAQRILAKAGASLTIREEIAGFRYLDARDLTGFVDGTENPQGDERADVAMIGDEDPAHAGGSFVMAQRYVHDLSRWNRLAQQAQEAVIGRTKDSDEELDDAVRPDSAHISRVVIDEDGEELEILRHSMPYGDNSESGLLFIAYSRRQAIFDAMLDRMFDTAPEGPAGVHDHLMDYTQAKTGAYFFAPSLEALAALRP